MVPSILTGEQAEEFKRVYARYALAMVRAAAVLKSHGMDSRQFAKADDAAGKLWRRLRELQGMAGKSWME